SPFALANHPAPGAPTGVTAVPGVRQATVTWTAPTVQGSSAITGYVVTSSPGGAMATAGPTATMATVTGLTAGTGYSFVVTASNAAGAGPPSDPSNVVVATGSTSQTITFATISAKTMTQSPLTVAPTASSGLPVALLSTTTPVCTVSGSVVTFVTAGSCSLTASQPGNTTYKAATSVTRTFTIKLARATSTDS